MEKVFYINANTFNNSYLAKAIIKSIELANKENLEVAIVVPIVSQFSMLDKIFPKDALKNRAFHDSKYNITFHFFTAKTYLENSLDKHIFVPVCLCEKELIKFEDEWNSYYWVVVPYTMASIKSWLKIHKAQDIATNKIIENDYILDEKVKNAIGWLKATSYPNEGFNHPLDLNRLKCMANAVNSCSFVFDYDSILSYCLNNGINHDGGRKIADAFIKASKRRYKTDGNYPLSFLKEMMEEKHK